MSKRLLDAARRRLRIAQAEDPRPSPRLSKTVTHGRTRSVLTGRTEQEVDELAAFVASHAETPAERYYFDRLAAWIAATAKRPRTRLPAVQARRPGDG